MRHAVHLAGGVRVAAQLAHVVLERAARQVAAADDGGGDARSQRERQRRARPAAHHPHERRLEVRERDPLAGRVLALVAPQPQAFQQRGDRRHHGVGRQPAQRHPRRADDAEVLEAAKRADAQRGVRRRRRARRGQRRRVRAVERVRDRDLQRLPGAALLQEAAQPDDAEVDAVAGDDAEQERGRDVEVTDRELGEPEGQRAADGDGAAQRDQRARRAEEQQQHAQHQRDADAADVDHVAQHQVVLRHAGDQIAGISGRHVRREPQLGQRRRDDGLHAGQRLAPEAQVAAGDGRLAGDHLRPARRRLREVIAVRVVDGAAQLVAQALVELVGVERRGRTGRAVVTAEIGADGVFVGGTFLRDEPPLQIVDVGLGEVEPGARHQEAARVLDAAAHERDVGRADGLEPRHQRVGRASQLGGISTLEHDEHVRQPARARQNATQLHDAGRVLLQQVCKICHQPQLRGAPRAQRRQQRGGEQEHAGPARLKAGESAPEPLHHGLWIANPDPR